MVGTVGTWTTRNGLTTDERAGGFLPERPARRTYESVFARSLPLRASWVSALRSARSLSPLMSRVGSPVWSCRS